MNGISQTNYDKYANNTELPFLSRFTQRYAPGSTFKMLTAAIALQNKTITPDTTKSISGLKWQKDSSWGDYKVTRTVDASPENMTQALVNSDNIWFAQVALKMGASAYLKGLEPLFKTQANLPLTMKKAQISNNGKLASKRSWPTPLMVKGSCCYRQLNRRRCTVPLPMPAPCNSQP